MFIGPHLGKGGGLVLQRFRLFNLLREHIEAHWICLDAPGPHRHLAQHPDVSIVGTLAFPTGIWHLQKAIRAVEDSFDVFQVVDPYYALPASYLSRVTPRAILLGTDPRAEMGWRYGPAARALVQASLPVLLDGSPLIVNSGSLAERFRRYRPHVIPNGVDVDRFARGPRREEARRLLALPEDSALLLFVGKIVPIKRLEWLLEVMERLPETQAVVVGGHAEDHYGNRYYRHLLASFPLASKRVRFVGEVPWDNVPIYLAAANVFVFPSRFEGQPSAVLEALAAGLPVVASDIPAHREVIHHGTTGFLAQDPLSMAGLVDRLLKDQDLQRRVGAAAQADARNRFSFDRCVEGYLALYRTLLDAEPRNLPSAA